MRRPKQDDLTLLMKEYFHGITPPGTWTFQAHTGWSYEDILLYAYNEEMDMYWMESVSAEEIQAARAFGDCIRAALIRLKDRIWECEEYYVRGY